MPAVRPIFQPALREKENAANRVYDGIKARLLDGEFRAGDRLAIEAIAGEFEVSRFPVMDAVKRLSVEGFVTIVPQVGCRVASYSEFEAEDFFRVSIEVGSTLAALAARRRTPEQLFALEDVAQEIRSVVRRRAAGHALPRTYRLLNRQFHLIVHDMANSRLTSNLAESMMDRLDFMTNTMSLFLAFPKSLEERFKELENLRRALVAGNAVEARQAYEAQLSRTKARSPR
jgi:DNA-binding GntR family transcriptional regulator